MNGHQSLARSTSLVCLPTIVCSRRLGTVCNGVLSRLAESPTLLAEAECNLHTTTLMGYSLVSWGEDLVQTTLCSALCSSGARTERPIILRLISEGSHVSSASEAPVLSALLGLGALHDSSSEDGCSLQAG
ncbi:uncharacterized protein BDW70DRAFT_128149 [Aspergillus foveolatus]|uniref:uncharacterized protein n=1 Tax=Aspergillus foveolatus TaxID=210207 RepID=UPI003CCC9759